MGGFGTSHPASVALCAFLCFLNLFAFLLAVGAERRRSTGKVVPDKYDDRSYCLYDTDASTVYGVSAFFVLLLQQAIVTAATRCLCFGPSLSSRGCAVAAFVLSWITFLIAEACLIGGSVRNAKHTKYLGYYMKHDLVSRRSQCGATFPFRSPSPLSLWCPAACCATTSAMPLPRPSMAAASFARAVPLIVVLLLLADGAWGKTVKRDVKALNEIKSSLGWRVVYSWVGDDPCGHGDLPPWSGVTCSQQGDYRVVTELEVYAVSIVGPFPTAVTNLLDLRRLDLHNNKLTGPIPPQIGRLKHLRILNLRWNKLQDVLPPEIGELKKLTHLYLSFNNFKGEIPVELANLPELRYLYLHENRFTGRIPPELGTLKNLRHLDVGNNHLTGTLRDLISNGNGFPSLRNLYLNNNELTGVLPDQIANLTNLEILHLSNNKMIGSISPKLVNIPRLIYLYLDNNNFIGRIPEGLYKHPFLKELYIEGNHFRPGTRSKGTHKVLELPDADILV